MSGTSALAKINKRVNQLQKQHPGKKRKTLQKQAGKEYREGKMPKPRKKRIGAKKKYKVSHRVRRVGADNSVVARRKRRRIGADNTVLARRKRVGADNIVIARRTKRRKKAAPYRARRVGAGKKSNTMMILGLAAAAVGAYLLLRPKATTIPVTGSTVPLQLTGNATRDAAATSLVNAAIAAGTVGASLVNLISNLNSSPDAAVVSAAQQGTPTGGGPNTGLITLPGGPGIDMSTLNF